MIQWIVIYCLINSKKIGHIISLVKSEYFYEDLPLRVYQYILELVEKEVQPSSELILSRFTDESKKIKESLSIEVDVNQYEEFVVNLRKKFINFKIKQLGNSISATKDSIDEERFIKYVNNLINDISTTKNDDLHNIEEVVDIIIKQANSEEEEISKTLYGIANLDEYTGGLFPGDLILIAGRPSTGKSGLMGHIAISNAIQNNITVLFSLEMSAPKIALRMLSNLCNLEIWKLKKIGNRKEEEQKKMIEKAEQIKNSSLFIETTSGIDVSMIRSVLQKIKMKHGKIDLVIIDYLQLMSGEGLNENNKLENISKNLKRIAMQYNCPVVAGSQLSRLCEQRDNKRPLMSDLRSSGSLEQDADLVLMLYRDHYYNYNPDHERILEVLIRKFRNGEVGKVILDYNMKKQTFKPINPNSTLGTIAKRFQYE